jgi:hypothetical protein
MNTLLTILIILILMTSNAYAYIDPSFVTSILASIFAALNFLLLYFIGFTKKIKNFFRKYILIIKKKIKKKY